MITKLNRDETTYKYGINNNGDNQWYINEEHRDDVYELLIALAEANSMIDHLKNPDNEYTEWTVALLDEDMNMIDESDYTDYDKAYQAYREMICEQTPKLGARLARHTNWIMIDGMFTSRTWTDLQLHEAGTPCDCPLCMEKEE